MWARQCGPRQSGLYPGRGRLRVADSVSPIQSRRFRVGTIQSPPIQSRDYSE
uniref:Uncharacterized protein n=2 Tax=Meloidogyne TaxID=189290 RepID=A0A6V7X222_MELEN|nr:unnamed protein product [Meloidogyne enterolobii]